MTINPCSHHPDAKGDDAPKRGLDDEGLHEEAAEAWYELAPAIRAYSTIRAYSETTTHTEGHDA